jgi:hypothetical protein
VRTLVQRLLAFAGREAFPIVVVGIVVVQLMRWLSLELAQDGWLAFLGGHEIAQHGLPRHDNLTVWAHGRQWVDQPWLSQLALYGLFAAGGVKLALLANAGLIVGTLALAMALGRRSGASALRTAAVAAASVSVVAVYWQLRTQSFVYLLFVLALWLLIEDSRSPTRRVFLVLPLLVLWANLHGSVVLAGALVALRGATFGLSELRAGRPPSRWVARCATLVLAPGLCIFASPYGFALSDYYRRTLFNPALERYIAEWRPPTFSFSTAPIFAVALAAIWLLGRSRSLTAYERLVIVGASALAIVSIRNCVWLGLAAAVVLPRALEEAWPSRPGVERVHLNRLVALAAVAAALVSISLVAARPLSWLHRDWPKAASAAVAREVAARPSVRVFATLRYADWLLLEEPALKGRMALDARVELLSRSQLRGYVDLVNRIGYDSKAAASGYRVIVLDPAEDREVEQSFLAEPGVRPIYRDAKISVLSRG